MSVNLTDAGIPTNYLEIFDYTKLKAAKDTLTKMSSFIFNQRSDIEKKTLSYIQLLINILENKQKDDENKIGMSYKQLLSILTNANNKNIMKYLDIVESMKDIKYSNIPIKTYSYSIQDYIKEKIGDWVHAEETTNKSRIVNTYLKHKDEIGDLQHLNMEVFMKKINGADMGTVLEKAAVDFLNGKNIDFLYKTKFVGWEARRGHKTNPGHIGQQSDTFLEIFQPGQEQPLVTISIQDKMSSLFYKKENEQLGYLVPRYHAYYTPRNLIPKIDFLDYSSKERKQIRNVVFNSIINSAILQQPLEQQLIQDFGIIYALPAMIVGLLGNIHMNSANNAIDVVNMNMTPDMLYTTPVLLRGELGYGLTVDLLRDVQKQLTISNGFLQLWNSAAYTSMLQQSWQDLITRGYINTHVDQVAITRDNIINMNMPIQSQQIGKITSKTMADLSYQYHQTRQKSTNSYEDITNDKTITDIVQLKKILMASLLFKFDFSIEYNTFIRYSSD